MGGPDHRPVGHLGGGRGRERVASPGGGGLRGGGTGGGPGARLVGSTVEVGEEPGGEPALVLAGPPHQFATVGDLAVAVVALAHTAVARVLLPCGPVFHAATDGLADGLAGGAEDGLEDGLADGVGGMAGVRFPARVPAPAAVAKGWEAQAGRGPRLELPDAGLLAGFEAARCQLLLAATVGGPCTLVTGDERRDWRSAATMALALDAAGFHDEADRVVLALPDALGRGGRLVGAAESSGSGAGMAGAARADAAAGAALVAVRHHVALTGETALAGALREVVVALASGLSARRGPGRGAGRGVGRTAGRTADQGAGQESGQGAGQAEPGADSSGGEAVWVRAGLEAAADLLAWAGEDRAAAAARRHAQSLAPAADTTVGRAGDLIPARWLAEVPGAAWWDATRRHLARHACDADGRVLAGCDGDSRVVADEVVTTRPAHTLALAGAELAAGDPIGWTRVATVLADGGGLRTWPEVHEPGPRGSGWGRHPDVRVSAAVVSTIIDGVLGWDAGGLRLVPAMPERWFGQSWEAHEVPTPFGSCSMAVRWHGDRPALLWELGPVLPGAPVPLMRAPGLDPTWSSTDPRGEALLGPVAPPGTPVEIPRMTPDSGQDRSR